MENKSYFKTYIENGFIRDLVNTGLPKNIQLKLLQDFSDLGAAFICRPVEIITHKKIINKESNGFSFGVLYDDCIWIDVEVSENKTYHIIIGFDEDIIVNTYVTKDQAYELIKET